MTESAARDLLSAVEVALIVGYAAAREQLPMAARTLLEVATGMVSATREHATVAAWASSGRGAAVAGLAPKANAVEASADQLEGERDARR